MFTWKLLSAVLLSSSVMSIASAQPVAQRQIVIAPHCLLEQIHAHYQTLSINKTSSLIEIKKADIQQLIDAKAQQKTPCGGFRDVTRAWHASKSSANTFLNKQTAPTFSALNAAPTYKIQYQKQVLRLLNQLVPQNMMDNLNYLSSFKDRYADSDSGVKAAEWLKTQVETMAATYHRNDVSAYYIQTGDEYQQPSVVVKIGDSTEPGIVVGAHMDTLQSSSSRKPGADDDGSGSVTVLETARAILASGLHFKKPNYFVWYAAEEEGLIGSGYVVEEFKAKKIPVAAVMHFVLTGYAHNGEPTMWIIDDNVNKPLTVYLETLINTYVKQPVKHTRCGYDCSDHASWFNAGYTVAMPAEAKFEDSNPYMHSSNDTTDKLSLDHMKDYLKLATAFTVELAEPVTK